MRPEAGLGPARQATTPATSSGRPSRMSILEPATTPLPNADLTRGERRSIGEDLVQLPCRLQGVFVDQIDECPQSGRHMTMS